MCFPSVSATLAEVLATPYRASKDARNLFLRPLGSTSFDTATMPRLPAKKQDPCHAPEGGFGPTGESARGQRSNQKTISSPAPPSVSVAFHLGRTCRDGRVKVGCSVRRDHPLPQIGMSTLSRNAVVARSRTGLGRALPHSIRQHGERV
jgi:hypothetical protein